MTRDEYFKNLENNLGSLTTDEKQEALQYYSDYFDEANDDERLMNELGTPEELAKTIVEKMANNLVKVQSEEKEQKTQTEENNATGFQFYTFNAEDVRNLTLNFSAAEIVAIPGNCYGIETRGIEKESLNVSLSPEGLLTVSNNKRINFNFWSHDRQSRIVPRILLTIPNNANLNRIKVNLGAGSMEFRKTVLKFLEGNMEVGAGNLVISEFKGSNVNLRCGMGNLSYSGELGGQINIDCGMGAVKMYLKGNEEDYSYDAKIGLGDFRINGDKKSVVGKYVESKMKQNHISVNCGMGSVNIDIKK